ncbi:hemophore-related protein [Mycolicibacterium komossense]|jgi:hemophore-related protein
MTTKLVASLCGAAATLIVGGGLASATPDTNAIVNSTCSYPQVMAALNAQDPAVAAKVSSNPLATAWLQQLVAAPPPQRQVMVDQAAGVPEVQQYSGLIGQVATSCNNY